MTTQPKHTAAPWVISETSAFIKIYDANDNEIADVSGGHTSINDDKANARLIAAAPELLEALEDLGNYMPDPENNQLKFKAAIDRARAAIAKAKEAA